MEIRLGTRNSLLALAQTNQVASILSRECGASTRTIEITTAADTKLSEVPLSQIGGQGAFTKELEHALLDSRCDCAVHSLKDVPTVEPDSLSLACVLPRADPSDAMISNLPIPLSSIKDIPQNSRIGTSSLRRKAQMLALRPDLQVCEVRGNVQTRLRKLDEGQFDVLILAAAGLKRLNLESRIKCLIPSEEMMHAVGQGAIAVQTRSDNAPLRSLFETINCSSTWNRVMAERSLLRTLEGGCRVPIGVRSAFDEKTGVVELVGRVVAADGSKVVEGAAQGSDPKEVGRRLGEQLKSQGAMEILREAGRH
eukprot:ANDGO_03941.mRNA.1 Porphobilinogen deaminase